MDIGRLRQEYTQSGITKETLNENPFVQFELWFNQALEAQLPEPNAMSLATCSLKGHPNLRTVLLKYFDEKGFVFFTNYKSQKAKEINENPNVSVLFPWIPLERQVKIIGKAEKIPTAESLKYFVSRPYGSQLGAWVSHQSTIISSRRILEQKLLEVKQKFTEGKVPLPDFWGGYRIVVQSFEFWQGRSNRLHDRFVYTPKENDWQIEQLAP